MPSSRSANTAARHGAELLLRALRVRAMAGGLLDDEQLIRSAGNRGRRLPERPAPVDGERGHRGGVVRRHRRRARPLPGARALDHKLGGPAEQRRYTAPSYELSNGERSISVPGFNPVEVYETAIANLAPDVPRREPPADVSELLRWAEVPLATAEIIEIMQRPEAEVRDALAQVATPRPAGADMYWAASSARASIDRLSRALAV